jgi:transposase-like protein
MTDEIKNDSEYYRISIGELTDEIDKQRIEDIMKLDIRLIAYLLLQYKKLDENGNVYAMEVPEEHMTAVQLLIKATNSVEVKELLNMNFTNSKTHQSREIKSYWKNINLLKFSGCVGREYKRLYKKCSPRVKNAKFTEELASNKSNIVNVYPSSMLGYVKIYVKDHPLDLWEKQACNSINPNFTQVDDINGKQRFECNVCSKNFAKSSLSQHIKSCSKINDKEASNSTNPNFTKVDDDVNGKQRFECNVCDKNLAKSSISKHIKSCLKKTDKEK